jgi:hypothetical protein
MTIPQDSYSAAAAVIEQEKAEFANVKLTYRPGEIRPVDTESNIRGRIKGMFKKYYSDRPSLLPQP